MGPEHRSHSAVKDGPWLAAFALLSAVAPLAIAPLSAATVGEVPAGTDRQEPLPPELEGVGVTEKRGSVIPRDLTFIDDSGKEVSLGQYFAGSRPVLLTLNYSNCPMLCSLQLNGLVAALREMSWTIGQEFDMVTVSIDPRETTTLARQTKQKYLSDYGRPGAGGGWHFLTGRENTIKTLADSVGFGYRWVESRREFAHVAVTFVVTPGGVLSRYLYGVVYDPRTVRLSLVEASEGKVGSALDQLLLFCFHYDAEEGRYGPAAFKLVRVGGALTLVALGIVLGRLWRRDHVRRKAVAV